MFAFDVPFTIFMVMDKNNRNSQITILVAFDDSFAIGNQGTIPWHIAEDLRLFKTRTMGCPIIMGRKTWDSLPVKPLPGRTNIILSSTLPRSKKLGVNEVWATSLENAISWVKDHSQMKEIFIIGGKQVYEAALKIADRLLVSKIPGVHEADTYFPPLSADWIGAEIEQHEGFTVWEYRKIL
jgi:dihydrofolate reductase